MPAGQGLRPVEFPRGGRGEDVSTRELLPEPDTPVTQVSKPTGNTLPRPSGCAGWRPVTVSQRPSGGLGLAVRLTTPSLPARVGAGARGGRRQLRAIRRGTVEKDLPALGAGAGPEFDQFVGDAHGVGIALDDQDRVAAVAQLAERGEQPLVVMRVQADARFVEDVDHADEPHAELGRQPHALGLAAGERGVFAVEGQVTEAGLAEEMQPLRHAIQHLAHGVRRRQDGPAGRT